MQKKLETLLGHLQSVLDEERQARIDDLYRRTLNWEPVERLPIIMSYPSGADIPFQPYAHSAIFDNPEKMLFNELVHAFDTSIALRGELDDDLPCTVRANFGTVVIASMFGAQVQQVDENPPWVVRKDGCELSLESVLDCDPYDLSKGWCPRVIETYEAYQGILNAYPDIQKMVKVVLPDLQGPFDNIELILGSKVFVELYENEALVTRALESVVTAQIAMAQYLSSLTNDGEDGFSHQHAVMIKGRILLRNDSVIMMSPQMYQSQVVMHDERVLRALGGGGIHCCGDISSHAQAFLDCAGICSLDFGQPELNDLDRIYAFAEAKRIPLIRVAVSEEELTTGRVLDRFPTGVTLLHRASSATDAKRIMNAYRRAACSRRISPSR